MHAVWIAEELEIKEIIVPPSPGTFSAWGMLQTDIRKDLNINFYFPFAVVKKESLKKQDLFNGLTNSQESKVKIHKIQFLMRTIFPSKSQCASSHVSPLPISTSSGTSSPTTFSIVSFTISQSSSSSSLDASKISSSWTVRIILDCIRFS